MPRAQKPADLSVLPGNFGQRPEPPAELSKRQQEIWRETVASEAADFFETAATRAILADYCRHREAAEICSAAVDSFLPAWVKTSEGSAQYRSLLLMRQSETRASVTMATKLRLTNQARMRNDKAAATARQASKGTRPWEA